MLKNKKILLGVCGSIAAYKTALLIRLLVKEGAEVKVIMTPSALHFITPLTLSTLSKNPVFSAFSDSPDGTWNNHVELGLWADLFLIAPATSSTLGKMANAITDNLLLATYASARCPVWIAPAMDLDMWLHPANQKNIHYLTSIGNHLIEPDSGELASGLEGKGRMAEPEALCKLISKFFNENKPYQGKNILVTAGPTFENIDPVRFIGNHSSGKMGFALAEAFAQLGGKVTLVAGPSHEQVQSPQVQRVNVVSALEMYEACLQSAQTADIVVMAAAVADYRPQNTSTTKIKKKEETLTLELVKNPDILKALGERKQAGQILVGFALETDNELENAQTKLRNKNLDLIVLNSMRDKGAGFKTDTNQVTLISKSGEITKISLAHKSIVAKEIVNALIPYIHA